MKRNLYIAQLWWLLLLVGVATGCKKDTPSPKPTPPAPEPEVIIPEGISTEPTEPKADEALLITFRPEENSPLYNATSDLYAHIGVVDGGGWQLVLADWGTNLPKAKFIKVGPNIYQLQLKPTIRKWFGASETQIITKIGLVIRNSDGTKKAYQDDQFITVQDRPIEHPSISYLPIPQGCIEGINCGKEHSVTFVLNDQDYDGKSQYTHAYLIGDFNEWERRPEYLMRRDKEQGLWWFTLTGLDTSREYLFQYLLFDATGNSIRIADPYTEKIITPEDRDIPAATYPHLTPYPEGKTHNAISTFQIAPPLYSWQVTDFKGPKKEDLMIYEMHLRDFSTLHDLKGALEQLDRLQALGFNAIELMPTQEFSGNDSWGYNPTFYFAMDKAYGTKVDYQHFIDECHKRGMAVILDVVYNHMDAASPFVQLYSESGRVASNNPYFNQEAPHPYSVFYDFNHESLRTRTLVKRNLQFLLREYKLDGFRFDLSKGFTQQKSSEATASRYDASRVAILKEYHQAIQEVKSEAYTILEHFCELKEERELAKAGMMLWKNMNHAYCQAAMGYQEESDFSPLYTGLKMPHASLVGYMESHDEERVAYKQKTWGVVPIKEQLSARVQRLKLNALFFFMVPGPKMVWQYGEYAYDIPIDQNGRTGRKPVWTTQLKEPDRIALAEHYTQMLRLRKEYAQLFSSEVPFHWTVTAEYWTKLRVITIGIGEQQLLILGNFHPIAEQSYTLTQPLKDLTSGEVHTPHTLTLPAGTYRILATP